MSKGSLSLLRANPKLTTNYKLVVDTNYNLYLESYNTNKELSDKQYKKFLINSDSYLSQRLSSFYNGLPTNIAFDVKNDIKSDTIQNNYINQYDDIYYSGPRQIEDTRYNEEFQYNTTLKINADHLPKYFFIFRNDDPGISLNSMSYFFENLKIISTFDLTPKSNLGKLWKKNYIDDDVLPRSPIELNFKQFEFSQWNGYDYFTGGSVSKSFFMDEVMQNQTTDFELETFITDGFEKNAVISSNYTNISYLYDDTVSGIFNIGITYNVKDYPFVLKLENKPNISGSTFTVTEPMPYRKKWTINRYSGFYIDEIKNITKITSYIPTTFSSDTNIYIKNNKFVVSSIDDTAINPLNIDWNDNIPVYFKIDTTCHLVQRVGNEFILISDININGNMSTFINNSTKSIIIEYDDKITTNEFHSYIKYNDGTYFYNTIFEKYINGIITIKLFNQFYRLKIDNINKCVYILTDEHITCNADVLYRKLGENAATYNTLKVLTTDNNINYFDINYLQFTEVSDFDFERINTKHSQIEYDTNNTIDHTRPFIYNIDINDISLPKDLYYEKFYKIYDNSLIPVLLSDNNSILPQSSEYAASGDLYMLNNNNSLTKIWDLNQSINKWTILNSIDTNGSGYKINNSLDVSGVYNLTPNMYQPNKSIKDLNLDWFYSLGKPVTYLYNSNDLTYTSDNNIIFRTLNIDLLRLLPGDDINNFYKFDIEYYKDKNSSLNYFDYILNIPVLLDTTDLKNNIERISYLQQPDSINGPMVYFKGIKTYFNYVQLENPNIISKYTTQPANDLVNYGFGILFTPRYTENSLLYGKAGIEIILNKIHKNILVNIFIYTPTGSMTSIDYRKRDDIYNEDKIKYSVYDGLSGDYTWVDSELYAQSLTLNNFIRIISHDKLDDKMFSDGIKYTIIENINEFTITAFGGIGTDTITIKFTDDTNFKEGDWIKVKNTGITEFDINVQIDSKIDNKTIVLKFDHVITGSIIISNIIITKYESIYPFKLNIIEPEKININKNINLTVADTTFNIIPENSFKSIDNLKIEPTNDGLIPYVYVDDSISRRIEKRNTNKELNYNEIDQLPYINRFSADYEPLINNVEIFNNVELVNIDTSSHILRYFDYDTITNKLSVHVETTSNIEIGDIIYFDKSDDFIFFDYNTFDIINIEDSLLTGFSNLKRLTLNRDYTSVADPIIASSFVGVSPYIGSILIVQLNAPVVYDAISIYLYKVLDKNTTIFYDYQNFGIVDLMVTKTYDTLNPLKSSKDMYKTTNKYPMIDEHGITNIKRNIFKSSWDEKYYFTTLKNTYKKL